MKRQQGVGKRKHVCLSTGEGSAILAKILSVMHVHICSSSSSMLRKGYEASILSCEDKLGITESKTRRVKAMPRSRCEAEHAEALDSSGGSLNYEPTGSAPSIRARQFSPSHSSPSSMLNPFSPDLLPYPPQFLRALRELGKQKPAATMMPTGALGNAQHVAAGRLPSGTGVRRQEGLRSLGSVD